MRTGCYVEKKEVLAVVLDDVAAALSYSISEIKCAVQDGGYGSYKTISKDFLQQNVDSCIITRGINDKKRKCCVIRLNSLEVELQLRLKNGIETRQLIITILNGHHIFQ